MKGIIADDLYRYVSSCSRTKYLRMIVTTSGFQYTYFYKKPCESANGKLKGSPTIGDNVNISSNAVVIGKITVGNNVLIAPGAFVNFDVPEGSLVIGNPGRIVHKEKASATEYVYPIK